MLYLQLLFKKYYFKKVHHLQRQHITPFVGDKEKGRPICLAYWHKGMKQMQYADRAEPDVFVVLSQACSVLRLYSCIWYSPCSAHLLFSWPVLISACSLSHKHYCSRNQPEHHQQNQANCQRAIAEQTHHYTNKLCRHHCSFHRWTKLMHVWVGLGLGGLTDGRQVVATSPFSLLAWNFWINLFALNLLCQIARR